MGAARRSATAATGRRRSRVRRAARAADRRAGHGRCAAPRRRSTTASTIRLAFFKPAHGLTPELVERYEANRLTVTRQLPYEAGATKTLDLCLFVNGIPVATAELKNPLTGQTVEHAMAQYRTDRDPANVTARPPGARPLRGRPRSGRDDDEARRASGRGSCRSTAATTAAQGNPPNPTGHRTAYLWERVWQRDAWLDLLARFVHVEMPAKGSKAEKRSEGAVDLPALPPVGRGAAARGRRPRATAPGQNYLVQHSAGSGKSNTIAWLAHRLSTPARRGRRRRCSTRSS